MVKFAVTTASAPSPLLYLILVITAAWQGRADTTGTMNSADDRTTVWRARRTEESCYGTGNGNESSYRDELK